MQWGEFKIDSLFKKIKTKNVVKNKIGDLPATTAVLTNNQIGRYIDKEGATILENVFSATANGTGKAFFQSKPFTILQDSYAFKFKDESITKKSVYLFFLASLNKVFQKYSWDNKSIWERIRQEKIYLPIKNKQIDFDFIEKFVVLIEKIIVKELKAAHMAELKAYLLATGFEENEATHTHTQRERERESRFSSGNRRFISQYNLEKNLELKIFLMFQAQIKSFMLIRLKSMIHRFQTLILYVVRQSKNNGIKGYIHENLQFLNPANTISFAQDTFLSFVQKQKYFTGNNVKVLKYKGKNKIKQKSLMFIAIAIQKVIAKLSWGINSSKESILKTKFLLPIDDQKQINFDFIEKFVVLIEKIIVKELKAAHMAELKAYLLATGFEENEATHTHTQRERERERELKDLFSKIRWKQFEIADLFNLTSSKKHFHANKVKIFDQQVPNSYPYIVRKSGDNGTRGYIIEDQKFLNPAKSLSFAYVTYFVFYQKTKYYTTQIKILTWKKGIISEKALLFITACLQKSTSRFTWGDPNSAEFIRKIKFFLPVNNQGQIDFYLIEKIILELEKLIINDLAVYSTKKIDTYNIVIKQNLA
ncbi:restriction endonuclease subunit S [Mesomycoplasma hyopneumoniae]|uniref:restriction endonuclease subunit S n=1 Tax=Mesomycoplasma hyopneumoniae TaxID=2099 RepID=UPI003877BF2F